MQGKTKRHGDGSAGDANYGAIGRHYSEFRRPDPHIAALIETALGDARTVLNVGAGAGSYEPRGRLVTAVEPSQSMRDQRPAHLPAAIDATAEHLPFGDRSFDAAMSTFSVHQWQDLAAGLREMRRVTKGPVVIMTCEPSELQSWWLDAYCPEVLAVEATRYPPVKDIAQMLGARSEILPVPIPLACTDGSTKPITAARICCSNRRHGRPARPGALSQPMWCSDLRTNWLPTSGRGDGNNSTVIAARSRSSTAR